MGKCNSLRAGPLFWDTGDVYVSMRCSAALRLILSAQDAGKMMKPSLVVVSVERQIAALIVPVKLPSFTGHVKILYYDQQTPLFSDKYGENVPMVVGVWWRNVRYVGVVGILYTLYDRLVHRHWNVMMACCGVPC